MSIFFRSQLFGVVSGVAMASAMAQVVPDAGSLMRDNQRATPVAPAPLLPPAAVAAPVDAVAAPSGPQFSVTAFQLTGVTLMEEAVLQQALQPWLNCPIYFAELERAAQALAEAYRQRGWLARAQVPAQDISAGVVLLQVLEGRLGAVFIDPVNAPSQLAPGIAVGMLTARQKPGTPLRLDDLDRASNLLNDVPGVRAVTVLQPGQSTGDTDVRATVQDAQRLQALVQLDNHGARSTGAARLSANLSVNNPRGQGDQAVLAGTVSAGEKYVRLGYSVAVGYDGLRMGGSASAMHYRLQGDFSSLHASGVARTVVVYGSYPLVRSALHNLQAHVALDANAYRNDANGSRSSEKRTRTLSLGLAGDAADDLGDGSYTLWNARLTLGRLDLSGHAAYQAADQLGPRAEGGATASWPHNCRVCSGWAITRRCGYRSAPSGRATTWIRPRNSSWAARWACVPIPRWRPWATRAGWEP